MFLRLLNVMVNRYADTRCRACAALIQGDDGYGRSEGVCAPCRS